MCQRNETACDVSVCWPHPLPQVRKQKLFSSRSKPRIPKRHEEGSAGSKEDSKKAQRGSKRDLQGSQKGTNREQEGPTRKPKRYKEGARETYRDTKKAKTKPKREVHLVVNQMSRDFLGNPGPNSGPQTSSKYAKAGWLATEQQTGAR